VEFAVLALARRLEPSALAAHDLELFVSLNSAARGIKPSSPVAACGELPVNQLLAWPAILQSA